MIVVVVVDLVVDVKCGRIDGGTVVVECWVADMVVVVRCGCGDGGRGGSGGRNDVGGIWFGSYLLLEMVVVVVAENGGSGDDSIGRGGNDSMSGGAFLLLATVVSSMVVVVVVVVVVINWEDEDQISELPDCVMGYIVSLLSIKDAVKTSALSRR
ncbi:unnamed protein product [Fraxinus pennsylvanica]|uniref:Transmembrane protein n=1 Tax=Fraxinus pennsylvanica TaxID=56036 RepID=A0AAD1Z4U3_9LAMI|nr:unnamed protein product [Fraxinus pennsylvanica]